MMAGRSTLSVSLKADKLYIQALTVIAKKRGKTVGEIMRQAADAAFGPEIAPIVLFFEEGGNENNQIKEDNTSSGPGAA